MDENSLEIIIGFVLLIVLFMGLYGVTRIKAWLDGLPWTRDQ